MSEQKISVTAHTRTAAVLANWVLASRDATSAAYWAERSAAVEASQQHFLVVASSVSVDGTVTMWAHARDYLAHVASPTLQSLQMC